MFLLILEIFDQIWYFFINHIYNYWCDEFENTTNINIWVNEGFSGAYICPGFFHENDKSFSWIVLGIKKLSFVKINTIQQKYNVRRICFWSKTLKEKIISIFYKIIIYFFFRWAKKLSVSFILNTTKLSLVIVYFGIFP